MNVFLFKIQAADTDLCYLSQGTQDSFEIFPFQEVFGLMTAIS